MTRAGPSDLSPMLRSLQSGMVALDKLVKGFEASHADGELLVQSFVKECFQMKKVLMTMIDVKNGNMEYWKYVMMTLLLLTHWRRRKERW